MDGLTDLVCLTQHILEELINYSLNP